MAQQAVGKAKFPLHPGDLPQRSVSQTESSRDHVVSPNHQALATITVLVAAYPLLVLNADTEGSLCVCAATGV